MPYPKIPILLLNRSSRKGDFTLVIHQLIRASGEKQIPFSFVINKRYKHRCHSAVRLTGRE